MTLHLKFRHTEIIILMMLKNNSENLRLDDLNHGQSATIVNIEANSELRARLMDLGFTPGTKVQTLFANRSGDPQAYRLRGITMALRKSDASHIVVEPMREIES